MTIPLLPMLDFISLNKIKIVSLNPIAEYIKRINGNTFTTTYLTKDQANYLATATINSNSRQYTRLKVLFIEAPKRF
ncbi:hypothetical protein CXF86_14515 [Shewanella sp. GutCb]|nr:hypothetical protein CXF86_14515 [Shewanella sp. GutCb]